MRKKQVHLVFALVLTLSLMISACSGNNDATGNNSEKPGSTATNSDGAGSGNDATGSESNGKEPSKELSFPDAFPDVPKAVDPGSYDYDDMSKHYDIEVALPGSGNPIKTDPIADYMNKKLNVTLKLTNLASADFNNKITVRFAAGEGPDIVVTDRDVADSLFRQGQTVDALEVLPYMPQMMDYVTKDYKNWATQDGKMIGIPRYQTFPPSWGYYIRQDWLKELNMSMPTTEDELFAYAKAVTEQDPNKNGKADTWFMGGAGDGQSFGMMESLRTMYGPSGWHVDDNDTISHPMLNGSSKQYLQFLKKLNDNKLLSPDWYTIGWAPFAAYTMNDQIGMVNYPGLNLLAEQYAAKKNDIATLDFWAPTQPFKSNEGKGGKYEANDSPGALLVISKKAAKDPGKLKRIAHFLDTVIYPNENYWVLVEGGAGIYPDYVRVVMNDDGTNMMYRDKPTPISTEPELQPVGDWQNLAYTLYWELFPQTDEKPFYELGSKYNQQVIFMPRYKNYDLSLQLDSATSKRLGEFVKKEEIAFVLGKRSFDDWDNYVSEWKRSGGDALMKQAAEQLGASMPN